MNALSPKFGRKSLYAALATGMVYSAITLTSRTAFADECPTCQEWASVANAVCASYPTCGSGGFAVGFWCRPETNEVGWECRDSGGYCGEYYGPYC